MLAILVGKRCEFRRGERGPSSTGCHGPDDTARGQWRPESEPGSRLSMGNTNDSRSIHFRPTFVYLPGWKPARDLDRRSWAFLRSRFSRKTSLRRVLTTAAPKNRRKSKASPSDERGLGGARLPVALVRHRDLRPGGERLQCVGEISHRPYRLVADLDDDVACLESGFLRG